MLVLFFRKRLRGLKALTFYGDCPPLLTANYAAGLVAWWHVVAAE